MDVGCSLKGSTASVIAYWDSLTFTSSRISASSPKSGDTSVVVTV
jgi:hypothetical protein